MNPKKKAAIISLVLALMLGLGTAALGFAQSGRGLARLSGTVVDEEGRPVVGAVVFLTYPRGGFKAQMTTGAKGEWSFIGLGTGTATLSFTADGYRSVSLQITIRQLETNKPVRVVMNSTGKKNSEILSVQEPPRGDQVKKSYTVRFISPETAAAALQSYIVSYSSPEPHTIAVVLTTKNVTAFEEKLKALDVQRPTIVFRIFLVVASRDRKAGTIDNKDLRGVLDELSKLLNFKSYRLAGTSILMMKDGGSGDIQISVNPTRVCSLDDVRIATGADGKRTVQFSIALQQYAAQARQYQILVDSRADVAENGYLVAGVSQIDDGDSLAVVINAEIQ